MTAVQPETEAAAARLAVPGYARDARRNTCLPAELPFFNDRDMAARLIHASLDPVLETLPPRCRIADLGGADGYVAEVFRDYLATRGISAEAVVVDANLDSLQVAQRRGLAVVPSNLESVRLAPVHVAVIRLVLQYNGLVAQKRILERAFECLVPGGLLILQAETGSLASTLLRNLLCRFLQNIRGSDGPLQGGRWLSLRGMTRMLQACGFVLVQVHEDFLTFQTAFEDLLALAWTRFHGTPTSSEETRRQFESFRGYANGLAGKLLKRAADTDLSAQSPQTIRFSSRHALMVATKPSAAGHASAPVS